MRVRPTSPSPYTPTNRPALAITHIYTEGTDSGTQWSDNENALSMWHRQDDQLNPWLFFGIQVVPDN